jgi:hypothetical protein|nr:MAG TPA: tail assembly chaperone protein [Caudoviricetes sp.]
MYTAIKDNKIIAVNGTGVFPCLVYDSIEEDTEHQVSDYVHCNGQFVLTTSDLAIEQYKEQVRAVRNRYLEQTDKYLSVTDFPITDEQKEQYRQYREYLRHYPEQMDWYEQNPLDFEHWLAEQA